MVSIVLGMRHSQNCRAVHLNYIPVLLGFGMPRWSNPWHLAMYLNAKLPILNKLPLTISTEEMSYLQQNDDFVTYERGMAKNQYSS